MQVDDGLILVTGAGAQVGSVGRTITGLLLVRLFLLSYTQFVNPEPFHGQVLNLDRIQLSPVNRGLADG